MGPQFQVNTYTMSLQDGSSVALAPSGNFVVVWHSTGSPGDDDSSRSIQGRRYAPDGASLGSQFQVNSYTTFSQSYPSVAVAPDGDFIVVWHSSGSFGSDSSLSSVQAQRYAADGTPLSGQFQVNAYTTRDQERANVGIAANGDFVVVWSSDVSAGNDTSGDSIQGQRFAADGTLLGGEIQINSYTTGDVFSPDVAVAADGGFVVVWFNNFYSPGPDRNRSVVGRQFASDGTPLGDDFVINSYTTGVQVIPSVSSNADGEFVVTWFNNFYSPGPDNSRGSVIGRRFASDGTPLGDDFQVNSYTTQRQQWSDVSLSDDGNFVVVWESEGSFGSDASAFSVQGQRFWSDGTPRGGEFQINTYTTSDQSKPSVAATPTGDFVVAWTSDGSFGTDTSGASIQAQRYSTTVFADGFESGDTAAWSSTEP